MAMIKTDSQHYENIASKIREKTGKTTEYRPLQMSSGVEEVYEAGKKSEYDSFWDSYQENGKTYTYNGAFAGTRWSLETFKPKYDIVEFEYAQQMFWSNYMKVDLPQVLDNIGITLDFSKCANVGAVFSYSKFTRLGTLDFRKVISSSSAFVGASELVTIDKIIVASSTPVASWFNNCAKLEKVIFEGEIGQNGLNLQWSKLLSKVSITSIINALSTTTSSLSVTLSKEAVNNAFETSVGTADGTTSAEWLALIDTRSNWTISLI